MHETIWTDGSVDKLFLRDDGSIRARMPFVNGRAHGVCEHYNESGKVTRTIVYREGAVVSDTQLESPDPNWRQHTNNAVPEHPQRERFVGVWMNDISWIDILEDEQGVVHISLPNDEQSRWFINDVRWQGAVLRFDVRREFDAAWWHEQYQPTSTTITLTDDPDVIEMHSELLFPGFRECVTILDDRERYQRAR